MFRKAHLTHHADISLNEWMTRGGDARIVLDQKTGLNRYSSAPFPREILAFASSTANDLSPEAHAFLAGRFAQGAAHLENGNAYAKCLDTLRTEIRETYALEPATDVFFAPSGTDLEYVGLFAVSGRRDGGIVNHLLGADEIGSGCPQSAAGRYFAKETALGIAVQPGDAVEGLPAIALADCAVRRENGLAHDSAFLREAKHHSITAALAKDQFPLLHIVHGSKTGLVLPHLDDVDWLRTKFGADLTFVVDACQARITTEAIHAYLERGIIVFITGSKFMGGPPFSGFALLPPGLAAKAAPLPAGAAKIFRRAEVPAGWANRDICEDSGNPGLALRLAASLFELNRFQQLGLSRAARVVESFTQATDKLAANLNVRKVACTPEEDADEPTEHPIEMLTLVTLDLCHEANGKLCRTLTFDDAASIYRQLIATGIRLGQPVRCVRLDPETWGATLRISLSMPQIVRLDGLSDSQLAAWFDQAMTTIGSALNPLIGE